MEPHSNNPFRVLGLPSTANIKDADRSADRLLKWIELGETPPVKDPLLFLGPLCLDRDKIKWAKQQIDDPRLRIHSELFWFSSDLPHYQNCQQLIHEGRYTDFIAYCESVISRQPAPQHGGADTKETLAASLAKHHLAVFFHSAAIAASRKTASAVQGRNFPPGNWELAFRYWSLVQQDELFWKYLASRARLLGDARLKTEYITQLRQELLAEILRVNVALGLEGLEKGEPLELVSQARIIKSSRFGHQLKTDSCEALVAPLRSQFERAYKDIQPRLSDKAISVFGSTLARSPSGEGFVGTLDQEKLRGYLIEIERSINRRILPVANRVKEANLQDTEAGVEILDGTAYLLRALSLAFNNDAKLPREALRVANGAQHYAATQEWRGRLQEDQRTLNFLSLQEEAAELAKAGHFRESLAKLEQAVHFASTSEDRRIIEQWKEQAQRLLTYEGLEPIDSAPLMYTGWMMFYGRRDFDPQTKSYIATRFFAPLCIPIFPIAAYRVIDEGGGSYRFLGKARLSRAAYTPLIVWGILLVSAMIASSQGNDAGGGIYTPSVPTATAPPKPKPNPTGPSPVRRATKTPQDPSPTRESERWRLEAWLDTERARIEAEEAALKKLDSQLAFEASILKEQRSDLERRQNLATLYGSGGPSEYEIDSYNDTVGDFKRRYAAFEARHERLQADIVKFDARVAVYNNMR